MPIALWTGGQLHVDFSPSICTEYPLEGGRAGCQHLVACQLRLPVVLEIPPTGQETLRCCDVLIVVLFVVARRVVLESSISEERGQVGEVCEDNLVGVRAAVAAGAWRKAVLLETWPLFVPNSFHGRDAGSTI